MKTTLKIYIPLLLLVALSSWIYSGEDDGYFTYLRGKKQYVVVQGAGEPTIVFLTGKGRDCKDFKIVYDKLKKTNQIFAYDRAGLGQSEAFRGDRTVDTMAVELHELLVKEKIKPPYILVGHALGTYIMRCYVNMYPQDISGMVFIDPSHEYEFKNGLQIRNDSDKVDSFGVRPNSLPMTIKVVSSKPSDCRSSSRAHKARSVGGSSLFFIR